MKIPNFQKERLQSQMKWSLIVFLALLQIGLWLWMDVYAIHPYWLVRGDSEQDMAYTAWAWWKYGVMDYRHPGTPIYLLHGWLFGLLGGRFDTIPAFLFWSHGLVAFLRAFTVLIWPLWARKRGFSFSTIVLMLLIWMAHPYYLAFAEIINTDSYLPVFGLWFLSFAWDALKEPSWRCLLLLGVFGGFILAVKFATAPLVIAFMGALLWRLLRKPRLMYLFVAFSGMVFVSFCSLSSYPHSLAFGFRLFKYFLSRSDTRWHIFSLVQFVRVWRNVLVEYDIFWIGLFLFYIVLLSLIFIPFLKQCAFPPRFSPTESRILLLGLLALAWIYTLGAQPEEGPLIMRVFLNLGYRTRNTYIPTLGFVFLTGWIPLILSRRYLRLWAFIIGMLWLTNWGAFLHERTRVYTQLAELHAKVYQEVFRPYHIHPDKERVAAWTTKGFPIVHEAYFHWEGNYHPGKGLFTETIAARFPHYTLFNIRAIPAFLRMLPTHKDYSKRWCREISQSPHLQDWKQKIIFAPEGGVKWVVYWMWEADKAWHLRDEDIRLALCLYGHPVAVGKAQFRVQNGEIMVWRVWKIEPFREHSQRNEESSYAGKIEQR